MDSFTNELSNDCLVTDLVHELSSSLEIPFLLSDNITTVYKHEKVSPSDNMFYENSLQDEWTEDLLFKLTTNAEESLKIKDEINGNQYCHMNQKEIKSEQLNSFSGSGSGSESSSTEFWVEKSELYTPPITPPDERISPENVFLLPCEELNLISVISEDSLRKTKTNTINTSKKVRIQPKPTSTTLNIFDYQPPNLSTVVSNVLSRTDPRDVKNSNCFSGSGTYLQLHGDLKKSVLSKKEFEFLQAKKKQERMIRNRESAYLSRKRKKEHVAHLEKQVQDLLSENNQLKLENLNLRERLAKYEESESFLLKRKSQNIFTESPKKTTALLALMLTICLNIGSFSYLINERKMNTSESEVKQNYVVPLYNNEMKHTRSLLWAEPDFEGFNSSFANVTKTSCPLYINQTESIRLESELRRWIRRDEDNIGPSRYNISKISQYFYSGEKPTRHKNTTKRKHRNRKWAKEMDVYHMRPNIFNIDSFFEAIHRRDDTFYLVSFSVDHLLLPALSHNKTSRPKMSLMLPAFLSNATGAASDQVEMMQIDCEVTNTKLLSVNENDIPSYKRSYYNTTSRSKNKNLY